MRRAVKRVSVDVGNDIGQRLLAIWTCRYFVLKHKRLPTSKQDMHEQRIDAIAMKLQGPNYRNNPLEAGSFVMWNMKYALEEENDPVLSMLIWETFLNDDHDKELFKAGLRPVNGDPSVWMRPRPDTAKDSS